MHHAPRISRPRWPLAALAALQVLALTSASAADVADRPSPPPTSPAPASAPPDTAPPTTVPAAPAPTAPPPTTPPATVAAPAPPPPTPPVVAAAPLPAPAAATVRPNPAPAPAETPTERVHRLFAEAVPANWRAVIPARLELIEGATSWAYPDGRILAGRAQAESGAGHLADVLAHEFGHLIAFRYGSGEYPGAGPEGWPAPPHRPEEAWADCVQTAFTGRVNPSHGLPPCDGSRLDWVRAWLTDVPR